MNKKGFTLIELLAVVVILAIIVLIAFPVVSNIIENSRKNSAVSSANGYIDAIEKYMMLHSINESLYPLELQSDETYQVSDVEYTALNEEYVKDIILNDNIIIKGKKPLAGEVLINNKNEVSFAEFLFDKYIIVCQNNKPCKFERKINKISEIVPPIIINDLNTGKLVTETTIRLNYNDLTDVKYKIGSEDYQNYTTEFNLNSYQILNDNLNDGDTVQICAKGKNNDNKEIEICKNIYSLDLVFPKTPKITSTGGYPTLTKYGVVGTQVTIEYDSNKDLQNQYSYDAETWYNYDGTFNATNNTIYARSIKKSGLDSNATLTIVVPKDIITSEAYDGDDETFMTYHHGYNNIYYYDKNTYNKYMNINKNTWNSEVRIKWYTWNYSGYTGYIEFLDKDDNVLSSYTNSGGKTLDQKYLIPENATRLRYRQNPLSDANWSTNGKLYEIEIDTSPKILVNDLYPIMTQSGIGFDSIAVEINYPISNAQQLYKINDGEWKVYNGSFNANVGDIVYAKSIENGLESKTTNKTISVASDALDSKAYDNDITTVITDVPSSYMQLENNINKIKLTWHDNNSSATIYFYFADKNKKEIPNTRVTLGNLVSETKVYDVYEGAKYIYFSVGYSCYLKEVKLEKMPTIIPVKENAYPTIYGDRIEIASNRHYKVNIKYVDSETQKLYRIDNGEWMVYNGPFNMNLTSVVAAKSIDSNLNETDITSFSGTDNDSIGQEAFDGDENTYYPTGNLSYRYINVDPSAWGKKLYIKGSGYQCVKFYDQKNGTTLLNGGCDRSSTRTYTIPQNSHILEYYFNESGKAYEIKLTN